MAGIDGSGSTNRSADTSARANSDNNTRDTSSPDHASNDVAVADRPTTEAPPNTKERHVKHGDTVRSIAEEEKITVQNLYELNPNIDPAKREVPIDRMQEHWDPEYLQGTPSVNVPNVTPAQADGGTIAPPQTPDALSASACGPTPATPPDPKVEAARILEVGKGWFLGIGQDYDARLSTYTEANACATPEYREQLLSEIVAQDQDALTTWLEPERINNAVDSGKISVADRTAIAESLVSGYVDGSIPADKVEAGLDNIMQSYGSQIWLGTAGAIESANRASEFMEFLDAAPSNAESRESREKIAQYLVDEYALNDRPHTETGVLPPEPAKHNAAAALAALVVSGDAQSPETATKFLSTLDDQQLSEFLARADAGSIALSRGSLALLIKVNPNYSIDDIAQPDALGNLFNQVARAEGPEADAVAVRLARQPGDNPDMFSSFNAQGRAQAIGNVFNAHSEAILNELTNPDGFAEYTGGRESQPRFVADTRSLGALLAVIGTGGNQASIDRSRDALTQYAEQLKGNISSATTANVSRENGQRLGILGGAVTESINIGIESFADSVEKKRAVVGSILDLAFSAIPAGSLASDAVGDWLKSNVGSAVLRESLSGFGGAVIDEVNGGLTDAAKEHILSSLDDDEIGKLIVELDESNVFIKNSLFNDLPAPLYTPNNPDTTVDESQAGVENTIQNVYPTYDSVLDWLDGK